MKNSINELRAIVMRAGDKWTATGLPRVAMVRSEACADQVYEPMLQLVLQGTKSLSIGDQILHFVPATYFVVPVDLPALGQVCGDAPGATYLALSLTLDPAVIAASVAFSVGYESTSQFSREYARMFGMPPVRDVSRFKTPARSLSRELKPEPAPGRPSRP